MPEHNKTKKHFLKRKNAHIYKSGGAVALVVALSSSGGAIDYVRSSIINDMLNVYLRVKCVFIGVVCFNLIHVPINALFI